MPNSKIRALIVDDEPTARRGIRLLLQKDEQVTVVGECANGQEALAAIERQRPDLIFLDVQMPGMNGLDVLANLPASSQPQVIFVTAYDKYALDAFELEAVDYLLKPFGDRRFHNALKRAKEKIQRREWKLLSRELINWLREQPVAPAQPLDTDSHDQNRHLDKLLVKTPDQLLLLPVGEIDWIESNQDYLQVHVGKNAYLIRDSMNSMEAKLDPERFVRIHRSSLVNLDRIHQLQPYFRGEYLVILKDGTRLRLARRRKKHLERALRQTV